MAPHSSAESAGDGSSDSSGQVSHAECPAAYVDGGNKRGGEVLLSIEGKGRAAKS